VKAVGDKCYALALSGGGDKGAWEAGVVKGLVGRLSAEERQWSVATGISAGSIVTAGMALFDIGDEEAMADFLVTSVLNFTNVPGPAHVFESWPGGYLQALGESGLYHTDLEFETLKQTLSLRPLADRKFVIGATDDATAQPVFWEEGDVTNSDGSVNIDLWAKIVRASSAVSGAFQTVLINGVTHSDGGGVMGTNVFSAITRCLEAGYVESDVVVDVVTTDTDVLKSWSANEDNVAPQLQTRGTTVQNFNRAMADIDDACNAFPSVSWRYYVQAGDLPSNGANFNATQMQEMVQIGLKAAAAAEVGTHCAVAEANRPSNIVPKLLSKKRPDILLV
jgi:predicted acylesterase/phospholipase RssA